MTASLGGLFLGLAMLVPGFGNLLGTALRKKVGEGEWVSLGRIEDLPQDRVEVKRISVAVQDGWQHRRQEHEVIVIPGDKEPKVLSPLCPHLACSVIHEAGTGRFLCPCHQTYFEQDGTKTSGPSPRDLDPLPTKIEEGVLYCRWVVFETGIPDRVVVG